ncbi:MAG: hypothetical protein E4H27_02555 [Anaerolineales bacterium]|nr:MAG: hypothetical protein E4H27_02555 [Anaerolineales bacterium]
MPCPKEIPLPIVLGTDVMYDHHRTMGPQGFRAFPWAYERIEKELEQRPQLIELIQSYTPSGECEARRPYALPVMDMLHNTFPAMHDRVQAYHEINQPNS